MRLCLVWHNNDLPPVPPSAVFPYSLRTLDNIESLSSEDILKELLYLDFAFSPLNKDIMQKGKYCRLHIEN